VVLCELKQTINSWQRTLEWIARQTEASSGREGSYFLILSEHT